MMRFVARLNDGSFINIFADRMELVENMIQVYTGNNLVALVDISVILTAELREVGNDWIKV